MSQSDGQLENRGWYEIALTSPMFLTAVVALGFVFYVALSGAALFFAQNGDLYTAIMAALAAPTGLTITVIGLTIMLVQQANDLPKPIEEME